MNPSLNTSGATEQPKVVLRAMEPEDLEWLYAMENDREVWHIGNTSVPYSRYVLHDYIANSTNDIYHDGQVRMIVVNADGNTVGMADLFDFNASHRRAELSIVVMRGFRRCGYAEASVRYMLHYAQRILHLNQVYAMISVDNKPSIALFDKCGFIKSANLQKWLFDGEKYIDAVVMSKFF